MKLIFEEGIAFATSGVKYSYRTNFVSNFTSFVLLVLLLGLACERRKLRFSNRFSASVDWPPRLSARTRGCICSGLTPPLSETPAFTQFAPRCVRARLASFPVDLLRRSPFRYCWCICAPIQACSNSYSFPWGPHHFAPFRTLPPPARTESPLQTSTSYRRLLSPSSKRS